MTGRKRILWINRYCLADTSSGAAISAREMLIQLSQRGFDVLILGMTVFDRPVGRRAIADQLDRADPVGGVVKIKDGPLTHNLVVTQSTASLAIQMQELNILFTLYTRALREFKPDIVFYYGGSAFDLLIPTEAKRHGAHTIMYCANGSYSGTRWCQDVDTVLTATEATAEYYFEHCGIQTCSVGLFVPPARYMAENPTYETVTFINPVVEKGGGLVVQIAAAMEKRRPDIPFCIVESRGTWHDILQKVAPALKMPDTPLQNVSVVSHILDMRPIYAKTRLLLLPSLFWEAAGRVLVEAMINGVPSIVTNHGGPPEVAGLSAVKLTLPDRFYEMPYAQLLHPEAVDTFCEQIEKFFSDEDYFQMMSARAKRIVAEEHSIDRNADRLAQLLRDRIGGSG